MAAFVMMESTAGLFLAKVFDWNDPKIAARRTGWFFGYVGLVIVIVQGGLIGRLTKRVGEWPLAIMGAAFVSVGMAFYVGVAYWPATLLVLAVAGALNAIGRSLQGPTMSSLLSKYTDPREQGVTFGLYHGLSSIARVVGPIAAGLTYPYWRNTGQFWTSGVVMVLVGVWTVAVRAQARDQMAREPSVDATGQAAMGEVE
jgi:MFS family permease